MWFIERQLKDRCSNGTVTIYEATIALIPRFNALHRHYVFSSAVVSTEGAISVLFCPIRKPDDKMINSHALIAE
jgi:hypothetical protein